MSKMKIKLHNSLTKICKGNISICIFDEKIFIYASSNNIRLHYGICDFDWFLIFSPETKKLEESYGFGNDRQVTHKDWWKNSSLVWREIGEKDED